MIYSSFKAAHHLDRIAKLRKGELIWPTQVQIDLTNKCNHRCPYCFYRCARTETLNALFNESDWIPSGRMIKLLGEFSKCGKPSVQYTGGGEPMKHPCFYEIIEATIQFGLDFALVTNGVQADLSRVNLFKRASWVRVSLDAARPATYAKSQACDEKDFEKALNFVKALVQQNGETVVGLSFVVNPFNYTEIVEFAQMAKSLGVANVRYSVAYTPRGIGLYKDKWAEIEKIAQEAKHLEDDKFKVFNLIVAHLENLDLRQKGYTFCGYQHFTAVVGADQVVYPCCTLKYNGLSGFGSLKDQSFSEIWTGEKRRKWLSFDHLRSVCDKNPCWMDKKNEFISYLVQPNPPHVNYV